MGLRNQRGETAANRAVADQFAANVLPIVRAIQASGLTTLREIAASMPAAFARRAAASGIRARFTTFFPGVPSADLEYAFPVKLPLFPTHVVVLPE